MIFSKATILTAIAALSSFALAEQGNGQMKVHVVRVSDTQGSLKFSPEELTAVPGEAIQFQFYPKNHSVVQSSFDDPCIPISQSPSGNNTKGFFSGFMPVAANAQEIPTFTIPIADTKPIWFYCATGAHCQNGMVGVINAPANNPNRTLALYKEKASKAKSSAPGSEFGGDDGKTTPGGTAPAPNPTGTATGSVTGSAPKSTTTTTATGSASSLSATFSVLFGVVAVAFFLA